LTAGVYTGCDVLPQTIDFAPDSPIVNRGRAMARLSSLLSMGALLLAIGCGVSRNFTFGFEQTPAPTPEAQLRSPTPLPETAKPAPSPEPTAMLSPETRPQPRSPTPTPEASRQTPSPEPSAVLSPVASPSPEARPTPPGREEGESASGRTAVLARGLFQSADACNETERHVVLKVPDAERLDPSYKGPVPGIEFREITRFNNGGIKRVKLSGGRLELDIWADGKGFLLTIFGSESCSGGEGANIGYDVIAHYR
jgi:hypothetical protein